MPNLHLWSFGAEGGKKEAASKNAASDSEPADTGKKAETSFFPSSTPERLTDRRFGILVVKKQWENSLFISVEHEIRMDDVICEWSLIEKKEEVVEVSESLSQLALWDVDDQRWNSGKTVWLG